jgi:putative hemolysin
MKDLFAEIFILILLLILNAFFAASEIAMISLNDNKIKSMAETGHKKAKLLQNLLSEPSRFLATIQIGITLAGFLASAFAAQSFAVQMAQILYRLGVPLPQSILESISVVIITLLLSYFTLVVGELVPKRVAMKKSEPIAMFAVTPLTLLSKASAPFVKLLTLSTNLLVRLFGVDPNDNKEEVTEEEIRMMVDVGNENGTIQATEKMMINNIFEFDNKVVSDIMTHRNYVAGIPIELSLKEVAHFINVEKYTRFPVFEDSLDNIVGILHVKDLIQFVENEDIDQVKLKDIIRAPYFVPFSKRTDQLLLEFQKKKVHMAVAVDEYGGTAGIVTIEDLIEEIVGNIFDEYDEDEKDFEKLDENTYLMNGIMNLRDVEDILDVRLPIEDFDTLSGFIIGQIGRIPDENEQPVIEFNGVVFKVEKVDERRVARVKVCKT